MTMRATRLLTLVAAAAAVACAPKPPAAVAPASPTPAASEPAPPVGSDATPAPGETPAEPGASATPPASPTPSATPSPSVRVAGRVLDLDGKPVAGATLRAESLDKLVPWQATVETDAEGRYELPSTLPTDTELAITASKPGWTSRRQVRAFKKGEHALDFGAGAGEAFFLSGRPEIASSEPLPDAVVKQPDGFRWTLVLSEPLDAANRKRFEDALRLMPANRTAGGGSGADDLTSLPRRYPYTRVVKGVAPYVIEKDTIFREDGTVRARVLWSDDGTRATFVFAAPPIVSRSSEARYQIALAAGAEPIRDAEGLQLGTGPSGALDSWPSPGELVLGAFRDPDAAIAAVEGLKSGTAEARWAATHTSAYAFAYAQDDVMPRLVGMREEHVSGDTRLILEFSEPLVAHDGSDEGKRGRATGTGAGDLAGITFMVGERGDVSPKNLDGEISGNDLVVDPRAQDSFGLAAEMGREFRFDGAAYVDDATGTPAGSVSLGIDPRDPRLLILTIRDRERFFESDVEEIAVRVEGVGDPAGNIRDGDDADLDALKVSI